MTGLTTAWLLATRRMGAHWRTSVAVGTGILLAAIILAFVPAYSRAMADLGLRFNVEEEAGDSALVTTVAPLRGLATTLPAAEELVAQTVAAGTGWFLEPQDRALRTGTLRADNVESREQAAKFTLNAVSEPGRLEVVEGALPTPGARETVISPEVAENLGLRVGDTIDVRFALTNCFPPPPPPPGELPPPADPCNDEMRLEAVIPFTISGLVVAVDPEAGFWAVANADPSLIVTEEDGDLHRMFLDYGTFRRDLGTLLPSLPVFATETFAADLTALSAANASGARERLDQVTAELRASEILVISALDDAFRA
ncbi:MAG TPA: hypothetical protein VFK32_08855, partial [Tepidiformaceae bacterium]|nr:hypothetical protein [Tepidiformaceae bacterium]